MPQAPAQVLEALALLEEAGDLGADLRWRGYALPRYGDGDRRTFQVFVNESASPKLLKGTKDLFPCSQAQHA